MAEDVSLAGMLMFAPHIMDLGHALISGLRVSLNGKLPVGDHSRIVGDSLRIQEIIALEFI